MPIEIKDPAILRKRWFDQPLYVLEHGGEIPEGNGAIIALMTVFPLYERYLNDAFKSDSSGATWNQFRAKDLKLSENPTTDADQFWNVFRDGLGHSGMFYEESKSSRRASWILPKVSLDGTHPDLPIFKIAKSGERVICLNPWGFVKYVLDKYKADPELISRNPEAPLLSLSLIESEEIVP